jgi:uncharacterized protein YrrD
MQFKNDSKVYTASGQDVGHISRVVLNPKTKEVTHIVVQQGFLFTEDKVVPLDLIASATDQRVTLKANAGDLSKLPPFEETHYVPLDPTEARAAAYPPDLAMPMYSYVPLGMGAVDYAPMPAFRAETERHTPDDTVAVKEGARVITSDDKHVGNVERVFTDSAKDRATYFVVSQGLLLKTRKAIPASWVSVVTEDEVNLNVGASVLEGLPDFQEA